MTRKGFIIVAVCLAGFTLPSQAQIPSGAAVQNAAPDPLTAGKAALEDDLYHLAQKQFETFLSTADRKTEAPERIHEAALLLMQSLHEQDKYQELLALTGSTRAQWKKEGPLDALEYWTALAQYELKDYDASLNTTESFTNRYPESSFEYPVTQLRAWGFLNRGNTEEALPLFERLASRHPESPMAGDNLLTWGKTLLVSGKTNRATEVFALLATMPETVGQSIEGRYRLGQTLILQEQWEAAIDALNPLTESGAMREPWRGHALLATAKAQQELGRFEEAFSAYRAGIEASHDPACKRQGGIDLGRLLLARGEIDEGVALLKELIADSPEDPAAESLQLALAEALLRENRPEAALTEFQHYLESFTNNPGIAKAHQGKGWALLALNRNAGAATEFIRAHDLFTDDADRANALFKTGDAYFSDGQYDKALEQYGQLLDTFDSGTWEPDALFQIGESWARIGDPDKATEAFQRLADKFHQTPLAEEAQLRMAQIKAEQRHLIEAIEGFDKLMTLYSNGLFYAEALHGRGMASYRLFRFKKALRDFDRVVSDYPESQVAERAFFQRALCHYGLGEDQQALDICHEFLGRYPDSPWTASVLFWLGKYHYNHEEFEKAEERFLAFAGKAPDHPLADDALLWAGISAARRKEYVHSVELLNQLVKDYPESEKIAEARYAQANALSQLAKCSAAILIFDEIITRYPNSGLVPAAWGRKADNQFTLGAESPERYKESIESYRMVVNMPDADPDLVLQAEYKIGRCFEKLGMTDEAFEQYYLKVILRYFEERTKGIWHNESSKFWFRRAAFDAADIMESKNDWRRVVNILERIVESDVPGKEVAKERIEKIHSEKWWLFY